jgi:hypothetical protein
MARARFTWQLHVEDGEGEGGGVDLSGEVDDVAHLRLALQHAAAQAAERFDPHDADVLADEEDGWELRAAPPPTPSKPAGS